MQRGQLAQGFCNSNLFPVKMKAIKWPGECGWSKDAGTGNREIWGDKGTVDMDGANTRAQVVSARRRFLGGKPGYCQKGDPTRSNGPGPVGSGVQKVLRPSKGERREPLGRRGCQREGSRAGFCWGSSGGRGRGLGSRARPCTHNAGEIGVFRVRHGGGEAGLGDRGLGGAGAGDRVGERLGSGSPAKATIRGAAEEQEVSRQEQAGRR